MLLVPDVGLTNLLDLLTAAWGDTLEVGLFNTAHAPDPSDVPGTYTAIEATFPGYARQTLENWTPALLIASGFAQTEADVVTWTRGAGAGTEDIFGYFVLDASGNLLWAESPPWAPVTIDTLGQQLAFLPRFSLQPQ